jgi:hypothetical protein
MQKAAAILFVVLLANPASGQTNDDKSIATLYRSSSVVENARYHIATFDASREAGGGTVFDYNWGNCMIAADLFQNQPGVKVKYWCEKGRFRQ